MESYKARQVFLKDKADKEKRDKAARKEILDAYRAKKAQHDADKKSELA
jgi:hypothetical protein